MTNAILGVNHQFLFPQAIVDPQVHTQTLREAATYDNIQALDCWTWRGKRAEEEKSILLDSGKVINYNIGDRYGETPIFPVSPKEKEQLRAYDTLMREIEYALSVNSKKIVFASGPDFPQDRCGALQRLFDLVLKIGKQLPSDVVLALEPTDRDIDKFFLLGPLPETVSFVKAVKDAGVNIGILLDMCHVPIMHETLESSLEQAADQLVHIHLGNCVIRNPKNPFYGDKHIPWDYPEGEYSCQDGANFLRQLQSVGYFNNPGATVSFEMRPYEGTTAKESLDRFVEVYQSAIL